MKNKLMILSISLLLVFTTACGNSAKIKNGEEVVASIKGLDITADTLYKKLKTSYGYEEAINMIDAYIANKEIEDSKDIDAYVDEAFNYYKSYAESSNVDLLYFIEYYAGISGISSEDEFKEYIKNQYKITLVVKKQIGTSFTDEEIENYYNTKYSEVLTVKHILIKFDENTEDNNDEAYNTALTLIGKLNETSKDDLTKKFEELAYEYSADSTYNTGGLIENFVAGDVVTEFYNASKALKDGEYTKTPVKTEYGYHIILKVSEKEKPSLKDATDDIRIKLAEEKMSSDSLIQYTAMKELRDKYKISFYDSDIETAYNKFIDSLKQ